MRLIVRMSVRLMIAGGARSAARSGAVEEALADAAHKISEKKIAGAGQLLTALESILRKDPQFEEAFAVASVSNTKLARYYVRSLEMAWKQEPHPLYLPNDDPGVVTLEHVLPRKTEGNWPQFSDEEAEAFAPAIGEPRVAECEGQLRYEKPWVRRKEEGVCGHSRLRTYESDRRPRAVDGDRD